MNIRFSLHNFIIVNLSQMFNKLLLLYAVLSPIKLFAQDNKTVKTDSSTIETKYFESLNSIRVFNRLTNKDMCYYTDYYLGTKRVREKGILSNGDCYGIWKEFEPNGKLRREIDYAKGMITYHDKKAYPFYDYQNSIKLKGDSIIKSVYGADFFKKYVVWDISHSFIYNNTLSGNWTDNLELRPNDFLIRYVIKFDGKRYPEMIEFAIDKKGKFIPRTEVKGLEKLPANIHRTFKLSLNKAIALAKQKGLKETSTKKAKAFLTWENGKSKSIYNGYFRVYVTINTSSVKHTYSSGRTSIRNKYDVYVFNPWSAVFVEKKTMENMRSWEHDSGSSTGLMPVK